MEDPISSVAIELVKELAKPVYEDIAQPVARQVGMSLEVVGRGLNAALAAPEVGIVAVEVWKANAIARLKRKLEAIPLEDRRSLQLNTVVPALAGFGTSQGLPDLQELFLNLIASEIDPSKDRPHPRFASTLSQMSSDNARLLNLADPQKLVAYRLAIEFQHPRSRVSIYSKEFGCLEVDPFREPDRVEMNFADLAELGLLEKRAWKQEVVMPTVEWAEVRTTRSLPADVPLRSDDILNADKLRDLLLDLQPGDLDQITAICHVPRPTEEDPNATVLLKAFRLECSPTLMMLTEYGKRFYFAVTGYQDTRGV